MATVTLSVPAIPGNDGGVKPAASKVAQGFYLFGYLITAGVSLGLAAWHNNDHLSMSFISRDIWNGAATTVPPTTGYVGPLYIDYLPFGAAFTMFAITCYTYHNWNDIGGEGGIWPGGYKGTPTWMGWTIAAVIIHFQLVVLAGSADLLSALLPVTVSTFGFMMCGWISEA